MEKLRQLGRIATAAALIGTAGAGAYKLGEHVVQQNKEIDALCGGPERQDCDKIEEVVHGVLAGSWGGTLYTKKVVRFIPKSQAIPVTEDAR